MTYQGLACFPARRRALHLPDELLRRHFIESLQSESCAPKTHGSVPVPMRWLPAMAQLSSSASGSDWASSELLHQNAGGSLPSWHEDGQFNHVRRASILLHRLSRIINTKSYQQKFKAPWQLGKVMSQMMLLRATKSNGFYLSWQRAVYRCPKCTENYRKKCLIATEMHSCLGKSRAGQ